MRNIIIAAVAGFVFLITVASSSVWYFASPYFAMWALQDAAIAGDKAEISERVDFPAVRQSMKDQINIIMAGEVAADNGDPGTIMGAALASAIFQPIIDGLVTPEGISRLVQSGKANMAANGDASASQAEVEYDITRESFSRFSALRSGGDPQADVTLVFTRKGLGWILSDIRLPKKNKAPQSATQQPVDTVPMQENPENAEPVQEEMAPAPQGGGYAPRYRSSAPAARRPTEEEMAPSAEELEAAGDESMSSE